MSKVDLPRNSDLLEEDILRANLYRLLAHLLRAPLPEPEIARYATMTGDETPIGKAVATLAKLADKSSPDSIEREYHELFIGLGRGELLPYGSYYLTGFLHEKPLARLRSDMERIGIERSQEVSEPEDHIAALCEMMSGMILGDLCAPLSLEEQKVFFKSHIGNWAKHFFGDLEAAKSSIFYAPVGALGAAFMDIEEAAFEMV